MNKELYTLISKLDNCSDMFDKADKRIHDELISKLDTSSDMFDEAYQRIHEAELEEKKKVSKKEAKKRERTEEFAASILSLVNNTLATADKRQDCIKSVKKYKNLGKITSEKVGETELSSYCISDKGLTISLNYSRKSVDEVSLRSGNFLNNVNIDWEYLTEILDYMNITIQRDEKIYPTLYYYIEKDILTITVKRPRKLDLGNGHILSRKY